MDASTFRYDPLDPQVLNDPYPAYAHLRRHAPVYRVPDHGFFVVSRYADVMNVLRQPDLFSSAAMGAAVTRPSQFTPDRDQPEPADPEEVVSIVGADGARHTRLRNVVNRGFTPGRIAALGPRVRAIAESLAAPLIEAGRCEFLEGFAVPLPVMVIAELLGVDPERRDDFRRWAAASVRAVFESVDEDEGKRIGECIVEMGDYFETVIEERRRKPGDDLVSELVRAEAEHGALTPVEVDNFCFTLLVAGSVTTMHLLGNAMRAFVANPGEHAKLCANPRLIPGAVEEALRFDSPVQMLFRTATEDVELGETKLPQGATLGVLFGSANRDAAVFPEAERFDVTRHPKDHIAFGHGVHFCLGAALARLEARTAFEIFVAQLREPQIEGSVRPLSSLVFRGPESLALRFAVA